MSIFCGDGKIFTNCQIGAYVEVADSIALRIPSLGDGVPQVWCGIPNQTCIDIRDRLRDCRCFKKKHRRRCRPSDNGK